MSRNLSLMAIYDYTKMTAADLFGSLFWHHKVFPSRENSFLFHEVHLSFGPLLVFPFILLKTRLRGMVVSFVFTFLLVATLASDLSPFSDLLLKLFFPLQSFRVPTRIFLLFSWLLPLFLFLSVRRQSVQWPTEGFNRALILLTLVALVILGATEREVILWVCSAVLFTSAYFKHLPKIAISVSLAAIAIMAILSFREKYPPTLPSDILEKTARIGESARKEFDRLSSPLFRSQFVRPAIGFSLNSAWAGSLSSLEGYFGLPQKFRLLSNGLLNQQRRPTTSSFKMPLDESSTKLRALYNVCCLLDPSRKQVIQDITTDYRPIWFPSRAVYAENMQEQINWVNSTPLSILYSSVILSEKPVSVLEECERSTFELDASAGLPIHVEVISASHCLMVVSMNYLRRLKVTIPKLQKDLKVLPVNASLAGVYVPRGKYKLVIEARRLGVEWFDYLPYIGLLFLVFLGRWAVD